MDKIFDPRVDLLQELRDIERTVRTEAAALEDSLRAAMLIRSTRRLIGKKYVLMLETVASTRFDRTAFQKQHAELYQQYSKPITYNMLKIKEESHANYSS